MRRAEKVGRVIAVQAALLTAALHLWWAVPRLSPAMLTESVTDSRPFLFVPAALLLLAVGVAVFRGHRYRRLTTLGGGTLAALLGGYPLYHGAATGDALASEPLSVAAVIVEAIGVVAFGWLYYCYHPERLGAAVVDSETVATAGNSEGDSSDSHDSNDSSDN